MPNQSHGTCNLPRNRSVPTLDIMYLLLFSKTTEGTFHNQSAKTGILFSFSTNSQIMKLYT